MGTSCAVCERQLLVVRMMAYDFMVSASGHCFVVSPMMFAPQTRLRTEDEWSEVWELCRPLASEMAGSAQRNHGDFGPLAIARTRFRGFVCDIHVQSRSRKLLNLQSCAPRLWCSNRATVWSALDSSGRGIGPEDAILSRRVFRRDDRSQKSDRYDCWVSSIHAARPFRAG